MESAETVSDKVSSEEAEQFQNNLNLKSSNEDMNEPANDNGNADKTGQDNCNGNAMEISNDENKEANGGQSGEHVNNGTQDGADGTNELVDHSNCNKTKEGEITDRANNAEEGAQEKEIVEKVLDNLNDNGHPHGSPKENEKSALPVVENVNNEFHDSVNALDQEQSSQCGVEHSNSLAGLDARMNNEIESEKKLTDNEETDLPESATDIPISEPVNLETDPTITNEQSVPAENVSTDVSETCGKEHDIVEKHERISDNSSHEKPSEPPAELREEQCVEIAVEEANISAVENIPEGSIDVADNLELPQASMISIRSLANTENPGEQNLTVEPAENSGEGLRVQGNSDEVKPHDFEQLTSREEKIQDSEQEETKNDTEQTNQIIHEIGLESLNDTEEDSALTDDRCLESIELSIESEPVTQESTPETSKVVSPDVDRNEQNEVKLINSEQNEQIHEKVNSGIMELTSDMESDLELENEDSNGHISNGHNLNDGTNQNGFIIDRHDSDDYETIQPIEITPPDVPVEDENLSASNGEEEWNAFAATKSSEESIEEEPALVDIPIIAGEVSDYLPPTDVSDHQQNFGSQFKALGDDKSGEEFIVCTRYSASSEDKNDDLVDQDKWLKTEIGGKAFCVDLRAILPYKRCLSFGGYTEKMEAIITLTAAHLPDPRDKNYRYLMNHLFCYVTSAINLLATGDYVLVYFHCHRTTEQMPPLAFCNSCFEKLDRSLRKKAKAVYVVHGNNWVKTASAYLAAFKPFASRKVIHVQNLVCLKALLPTEFIFFEQEVIEADKSKFSVVAGS